MTARPFFVTPKHYAQPLNVVGEHITVLASGAATGGYEIFCKQALKALGLFLIPTRGTSRFMWPAVQSISA